MSCEALRELFKDELEEAYSNGGERGETHGKGAAQREDNKIRTFYSVLQKNL